MTTGDLPILPGIPSSGRPPICSANDTNSQCQMCPDEDDIGDDDPREPPPTPPECPSDCSGCPASINIVISGVTDDTCSVCMTSPFPEAFPDVDCEDIWGTIVYEADCEWFHEQLGGMAHDIRCTDGYWYLTEYSPQHGIEAPCAQWRQENVDGCPPLNDEWDWVGGCCDGSGATVTTSDAT